MENWNHTSLTPDELHEEYYCYTFHCLYEHTPLAWEDIMRIDSVWIDLKITHQFLSDKAYHEC